MLKDLKRTKADKKAEQDAWKEEPAAEDYPYGLGIMLDNTTIKKLGLGDLDDGQKVHIVAEASVTETSTEKRNGKSVRRARLQIEKMAVTSKDTKAKLADDMYGKTTKG